MTESRLIDSSVWLAYLFNGSFADILESDEILLISVLSLFEIKRKLAKNKVDEPKIRKSLDYIRKRSLVISVDTEISEKAADISIEKNLPAIDSLIYATALINDAKLITILTSPFEYSYQYFVTYLFLTVGFYQRKSRLLSSYL